MNSKYRTIAWWLAVLALSSTWLGCQREGKQGDRGTKKPCIALIMKARTNPFFHAMEVGAVRAAKKHDVELKVSAIDLETDFSKQAGLVENAISQGVDAILIAPAHSEAIVSALLDAQKQGIRIINLDNRIDAKAAQAGGLRVETFIGPDNAEGAYKATKCLIERIGGEGEVAIIEGIRGADNAEQRKAGFKRAIDETKGKVKVVAWETADWKTEPAIRKMDGILTRHPNLRGVFCANDSMALGAIQAVDTKGKAGKITIIGYDNLEAAQKAIRGGQMHGTIEQHPDLMGEKGVEAALKVLRGESIPKEIAVPTDLVTHETLKKTSS